MNYLVRDRAVIFNLAGQVSHIDSMRDPVHGSRDQLPQPAVDPRGVPPPQPRREGRVRRARARCTASPTTCPVDRARTWCARPTSTASTRRPARTTTSLYNNVFGVRACSLRLTNVYGPRQLVKHNRQGFIGWFIRTAVEGRRDPDLRRRLAAARLRLRGRRGGRVPAGRARRDACNGEAFNVGGDGAGQPPRPRDAAPARSPGPGRVRYVEWPRGEEGDRHRQLLRGLDASSQAAVGWAPRVSLREGLDRTVAYYREHLAHYLDPGVRGHRRASL